MVISTPNSPTPLRPVSCSGYCKRCGTHHVLGQGGSRVHALALIATLEKKGRIDLEAPDNASTPIPRLEYLFGPARGQMFGVLECRAPDGSMVVLRAFSGQYNGQWQIDGWSPPLFDQREWQRTNCSAERKIKDISHRLALLHPEDPGHQKLSQQRRSLSQQLMKKLHALYRLTNFRRETKGLQDVFLGPGGIPTGTGDCCAPKLLNYAARHQLTPLGISEFYLGRENRSQTRQHGNFYSSCTNKCQPILGFLLCGYDD